MFGNMRKWFSDTILTPLPIILQSLPSIVTHFLSSKKNPEKPKQNPKAQPLNNTSIKPAVKKIGYSFLFFGLDYFYQLFTLPSNHSESEDPLSKALKGAGLSLALSAGLDTVFILSGRFKPNLDRISETMEPFHNACTTVATLGMAFNHANQFKLSLNQTLPLPMELSWNYTNSIAALISELTQFTLGGIGINYNIHQLKSGHSETLDPPVFEFINAYACKELLEAIMNLSNPATSSLSYLPSLLSLLNQISHFNCFKPFVSAFHNLQHYDGKCRVEVIQMPVKTPAENQNSAVTLRQRAADYKGPPTIAPSKPNSVPLPSASSSPLLFSGTNTNEAEKALKWIQTARLCKTVLSKYIQPYLEDLEERLPKLSIARNKQNLTWMWKGDRQWLSMEYKPLDSTEITGVQLKRALNFLETAYFSFLSPEERESHNNRTVLIKVLELLLFILTEAPTPPELRPHKKGF